MSLITRCPACSTMFKVVPDQLRISEGWVRCGQCDEVFDANAYLQTRSAPEQAVVPVAVPPELPATAAEPWHSPEMEPALEIEDETPAGEAIAEPVASEIDLLDVVPGADPVMDQIEHIEAMAIDLPEVTAPVARHVAPEEIAVSFMTAGQKSKATNRLGVAVLWGLVSAMLLVVLAAQVLVHERDRIAATEPAAIAWLNPLCELAGCSISPLRQIESVVIESSAFTKIRPDLYRLSFALKNTAMVDVATPALELTLTDMQDQALVRRVFSAKELGAQKPVLVAGGEWVASMSVGIQLPGAVDRISGYRLLAFYP